MVVERDVVIYMRYISLDVVVPEKYVWEFMAEFGTAFIMEDSHEGTKHIRAVDAYANNPGGWHVRVSVHESEGSKFRNFLHIFCQSRNLSLRDNEG